MKSSKSNSLTFQELILKLQAFFAERGAVIQQPYDVEVGAGTMAPETFLRVLGPTPYKVSIILVVGVDKLWQLIFFGHMHSTRTGITAVLARASA